MSCFNNAEILIYFNPSGNIKVACFQHHTFKTGYEMKLNIEQNLVISGMDRILSPWVSKEHEVGEANIIIKTFHKFQHVC